MDERIVMFVGVEKQKFHQHKNRVLICDLDFNAILVFSKFSFDKRGLKYLIS